MIKITHPNIENIANEFFKKINPLREKKGISDNNENFDPEKSVIGKISKFSKSSEIKVDLKGFYNFLFTEIDLYNLFSGKKDKLIEIINKIQNKYKKDFFNNIIKPKYSYKDHILKTFGYKEFRENKNGYWFAENLNVKVCPYCNREYTFRFPIYKAKKQTNKLKFVTDKKILFDFDHYLAKEKYPYLSLSFFNLIPSCSICNSRFKHSIEFDYENYIYPYEESFENEITFNIKFKSKEDLLIDCYKKEYITFMSKNVKINFNEENNLECLKEFENLMETKTKEWVSKNKDKFEKDKFKKYYSNNFGTSFFYGNLNSFEIYFKENNLKNDLIIQKKIEKAKNNIRVFRLKEVYNQNKDIAMEIFQKSIIYSDAYLETLFKQYEGTLFKNFEHLKGLIYGNYITDDEIHKRPLAKLTKDIIEELE